MSDDVMPVNQRGHFRGTNEQLCNSIAALLDLNDDGAVSHRVPGMAVSLLEAARHRLASTAPSDAPADVVEGDPWATGANLSSLSFEPGTLTIRKDGSGYLAFGESCVDWEADHDTGKDVLVVKLPEGEAQAIRDWLNKWLPSPALSRLTDASEVEREISELRRKADDWRRPALRQVEGPNDLKIYGGTIADDLDRLADFLDRIASAALDPKQ